MMIRGRFCFEVNAQGDLLNSAHNVEALRGLWLNREMVRDEDLGPGDPGDFDHGAWHVGCHLLAAGGVMRDLQGQSMWLEVSHDPRRDEYAATVSVVQDKRAVVRRLDSAEGRCLLQGADLLGFVEGNSTGRTSCRGVNDPPTVFNGWRRQDFDQPVGLNGDGGRVWEHWCTLRDIRPSSRVGTSVLTAYVSLVAALGDRFPATVARGRREYGHPEQLRAMVLGGFVAKDSALWETTPAAIPSAAETLFLESEPAKSLEAVAMLNWNGPPRYYMFSRRIASWSPATAVREDLARM